MNKLSRTTLGILGACVALSACAKRECTDEEREAAGADANDECTKVVPFEEYTADDSETKALAWESGVDLRIRGDIRGVEIVQGAADEISVEYWPQVDLAQGREPAVVEKTLANLSTSLKRDGGAVVISADRGDSEAKLGAQIVVQLPPAFDADVIIDKDTNLAGDVVLEFLGDTRNLEVNMDSLSDLLIGDGAGLRRVTVNTQGEIVVPGAFASLEAAVLHTSHGDIQALFDAVPDSHALLVSDFGAVKVEVPRDGDFTLRGVAEGGVAAGNAPSSCDVSSDPSPKVMRCGSGDDDGLTFDLKADDIVVGFR